MGDAAGAASLLRFRLMCSGSKLRAGPWNRSQPYSPRSTTSEKHAALGVLVMTGPAISELPVAAKRRGYRLTVGMLLILMLGGTLPVPLYVLYEKQMGFGPLGVTVVFAAYVGGTLFALVALGDLSDHIGRRKVLGIAVVCAAGSTGLFLAAADIGGLIGGRVVSGAAAGFATGTATAALAELQPRGDHRAAAVVASGSNMTG